MSKPLTSVFFSLETDVRMDGLLALYLWDVKIDDVRRRVPHHQPIRTVGNRFRKSNT